MSTIQSSQRPLLSYAEVAERYGFKRNTLVALVCKGVLPHVRLGRRFVRFDPNDIEAWIDAKRVPATAPSTEPAPAEGATHAA